MSTFPVLNPPRVLLHVTIPGDPVSWQRVGWQNGRAFNPNFEEKRAFLWQLKACCPTLRPDCVSRLSVRFEFWTAKTDAWNEDVDNFCKFYLDAMTYKKPKRKKALRVHGELLAPSERDASQTFAVWGDDRQIDELYARVHRSALDPRVEILVSELLP